MVAEAQFTFAERLKQIRAKGARLRSEAFIDYAPEVCGLVLNPVTLRSYNRLLAFDNHFATGGAIDLEAVLVWVWVHHPTFAQRDRVARRKIFRKAWRALNPRFPNLNLFVRLVSSLPRWRFLARFSRPTADERFEEVVAKIRHLMDEALYGFPRGAPEEDKPDAAARDDDDADHKSRKKREETFQAAASIALQAQILNTFRRSYGMDYDATETLPLKKLGQLWREHLFVTIGDKTGLQTMDAEEAALWREQLTPET